MNAAERMARNCRSVNAAHRAEQWRRINQIPTVRLSLRTRLWVRAYEWLTR